MRELAELRQGRYLTRSLRHAARKARSESEQDGRHLLSIGRTCADFLRARRAREAGVRFSVARHVLPAGVQAELVQCFEKVDRELLDLAGYVAIREPTLQLVDEYRT